MSTTVVARTTLLLLLHDLRHKPSDGLEKGGKVFGIAGPTRRHRVYVVLGKKRSPPSPPHRCLYTYGCSSSNPSNLGRSAAREMRTRCVLNARDPHRLYLGGLNH